MNGQYQKNGTSPDEIKLKPAHFSLGFGIYLVTRHRGLGVFRGLFPLATAIIGFNFSVQLCPSPTPDPNTNFQILPCHHPSGQLSVLATQPDSKSKPQILFSNLPK
ncbi:MAG: hypothetical protein ABSE90_04310 [Verrucomicrobiota bacterium]